MRSHGRRKGGAWCVVLREIDFKLFTCVEAS